MKRILTLSVAIACTGWGQTTVRLRYGGPQSLYHVKDVSAGTPAVVTVWRHTSGQQQHDLVNGDVIYVQFVPGCKEANGYRKVVNANQAAGTFQITDLEDNPVTCSASFDPTFESGLAGKVGTFTLRDTRPRIFLPGSGELLVRSKDPDGSGPQVAPVVTENDVPWQKVLSTYSGYITPGCDGRTPALCPNEERVLDAGDSSGVQGWAAVAGAYAWFADNSKTGYLNLARYLINHVHRAVVTNASGVRPGFGFPCDSTTDSCGLGSGCDWSSISMFNFALAYDLIRDQLTGAERQAFAKKMLNGWGGEHDCANQLQKQPGSANLTSGSKTVTGSGFSVYSPGDWVYFKTTMAWGSTGLWGQVVSVASDSEMTVNFMIGSSKTAAASKTVSGVDHFKIMPWDETRCGAAFFAGGLGNTYNVGAVVRRAITTLASAITADQTTITVTNAGSFPEQTPFYLICESEVMRVVAREGNQFTVERGQMYSTAASHSSGRAVVWTSQLQGNSGGTAGPRALAGEWYHNLTAQKAVGYLLAAFALAGDDARAAGYAEAVWNYYYDLIYTTNKEYWSGPTQGGLQNQGYQFGRWQGTHFRVGLVGRNAFAEGPIDVMDDYFWRGLTTAFLWTPPTKWNWMPVDPSSGDGYSNTSLGWTALSATLYQSPLTRYAVFWYRNLSGLLDALTGKNGPHIAAYSPSNADQADFRQELPSWSFHTETDFNARAYYGLVVSKRDWSSTAGMVVAALGWNWPTDHTVDQGTYLPGGYSILKGGKLLFGWDNTYGTGGSGSNWFSVDTGSGSLKSAAHPPWYTSSQGGQQNQLDRKHGDARYIYARGNFTASYKTDAKVVRQHRHLVHLKTEPEYVVIFDDSVTSATKARKTSLQYFLRYDPSQAFSASPDYRDIAFKKPTGTAAMISTKVLFPDGSNPTATYSLTSNTHKVTFDWGTVTSAQMITIHRVALGTTDAMPAVSILAGLDPESVGFEVMDGNEPVAMIFARNGTDRSECSFRTSFTGQGRILITGLAPGNYRVYREGQEINGSPFEVGIGDGTLYLEGSGGAYTVSGTPPATLNVDPLSVNFQYTIGGDPPAPQTFRATCTGGNCMVSTTEICPWLSVSPPSGPTPQDFTVNVDPQGMQKGSYLCAITVSAAALNSPQEVTATLDVAEAEEEPPVGSELSVEPIGTTSRQLLVRYGGPGLKRGESCTVELSDRPNWEPILESVEDRGGLARRILALGNSGALAPSSTYHVRAICGSRSATNQMTTRAAGATQMRAVGFKLHPPARIPAERLRVEYGYGPELGQSVTGSCLGGTCQAEVQVQTDRLLYFRYVYLDAAGRELGRSALQTVAVP